MSALKLIPITKEMNHRWFTLHHEKIMGYPFLPGAMASDLVHYRTWVNIELGVPEKWAFRRFVADVDRRCIVGTVGFHSGPRCGVLEVGYNVAPECRGKGVAVAALQMLIAESVASDPEMSYLARIDHTNIPSVKVAEKCGFVFERMGLIENGKSYAHYVLPSEKAQLLYGEMPASVMAG